jgi:hypothetical protein
MIHIALLLLQAIGLTSPLEERFVRVDRNGWATLEAARPEKLGAFERLWTWSQRCAPAVTETAEAAPCAATKRITIRAVHNGRRPIAGAEVVWGTKALIEQVPDELLPRAVAAADGMVEVQVSAGEEVFARVAGPRDVSDWHKLDVRAGRAELAAVAATDVQINAIDERKQPATRVRALVLPADVSEADDLPIFTAAEKCVVRFRRPAVGTSRATLWSDDSAPLESVETNARLSGAVVLPRGCAVRGTVIGRDAKAIGGAGVVVVFPLGKNSRGARRRAVSSAEGHFEVRGIACGVSVLSLGKKPFAPMRRELTIADGTLDVGRVVLNPAKTVRLMVTDDKDGKPVAGARLRVVDAPASATTNADGIALLEGIGSDEVDIEASADDYLPVTTHVQVGAKKTIAVRLTAGATIIATVVRGDDRRPVGPGTLWIDLSGTKKIERFGTDGRVRIGGLHEGTLNVEVRVPGFASHKLPQREAAHSEKIDFGTIALDSGATINGTVIDATTSAPVQARVRAPRPNPSGPRLSLVMKDWIEAASDENGQFQVAGLNGGDYRLLVEAPGFAPALTERITVGREAGESDAGTVRLSRARRLGIVCHPAKRCGSKAQLLLGDPNDDWAIVSAPLSNGRGEILQAPTGRHRLQLLDRGALVAEKEVVVPDDSMEANVEFTLQEVEVSGDVLRGGRLVDSGTVQFIGHTAQSAMPIVVDRRLDSASVDSEIVGIVPRTMALNVDDRGRFSTRDLAPGAYIVTYSGAAGVSPEQEVSIPEVSSYAFRIDIPATSINGRIVDDKGKTPDWARVELRTATSVLSADMMPDGRFSIDGAPAGTTTVHAYNDSSEVQRDVVIEANRETELDLTLHEKPRKRMTLKALDSSGAPRTGARLFLLCDGALTSADADATGSASFPVAVATKACLAAAFSSMDGWAFAGPLAISSDSESSESSVRFSSRAVTLAIESQNASTFALSAGNGFPLERTFPFIGWPSLVAPPQPLRLRGLPPGSYLIRLDTGMTRTVVVDGTKDMTVTF